MKTITILLLFTVLTSFSQKTKKIVFKATNELTIIKTNKKKEVIKTLRADVTTAYGKFSVLLIDYNKNNTFTDFRKKGSKIGSDGITLIDYKEDKTTLDDYNRRYITKNYPILINGVTFRIKNLIKKEQFIYEAELVKEAVASKEILKNKNGVLIDSLPNLALKQYNSEIKIKLGEQLEEGKFLYLNLSDDNPYFTGFIIGNERLKKLRKRFNINIMSIGIVREGRKVREIKVEGYRTDFSELFIVRDDNKILKLGSNNTYEGILFNDKGKVIKSNMNVTRLEAFLIKNRKEKLELIKRNKESD